MKVIRTWLREHPARASFLALGLLASALLLFRLGALPLTEPDEGRYGSIARAMVESGDWFMPRLYGRAHLDKPPLTYWLMAGSLRLWGPNEAAARLPAALSALLTVLLVWDLARRVSGLSAAWIAGAMLLTAPLFFAMARICDPNMLLTACITLAIWSSVAWRTAGSPVYRAIFWLALSLGFMVKGPVAWVVPALFEVGWWRTPHRGRGSRWLWLCMTGSLALALGWYVALAVQHKELWDFFLHREVYQRFFTTVHHRVKPWYYYLFILPLGILPWFPALAAGSREVLRRARTAPGPFRALALGLGLSVVFFSLSQSKLPAYILPLLPATAVLAGSVAQEFTLLRRSWLAAWSMIAIGIVLALVALYAWPSTGFMWLLALIVASSCAAGLALAWWGSERPGLLGGAVVIHGMFMLLLHAFLAANPPVLGSHASVKDIGLALQREAQPGDRLVLLQRFPRGVQFYWPGEFAFPEFAFPVVLESDRALLADTLLDESMPLSRGLEPGARVFVLANPKHDRASNYQAARTGPTIFQNAKYLLFVNPVADQPSYVATEKRKDTDG